jgi:hypothetical protein
MAMEGMAAQRSAPLCRLLLVSKDPVCWTLRRFGHGLDPQSIDTVMAGHAVARHQRSPGSPDDSL